MTSESEATSVSSLVADIVAAYVSNNSLPASELPGLLASVHAVASKLLTGEAEPAPVEPQVPAVSIKKSITPDFLICLEDGKKFKSLRRHLNTSYGLTPDAYRRKWNLPADYPMVAPNYSAVRSGLAKQSGLGSNNKVAAAHVAIAKKVEPVKRKKAA